MTTLQEEHQWLVEHHSEAEAYGGRWIAILDGKIVATGNGFQRTYRRAVQEHPGATPLTFYVPKKNEELLIF